MHLRGSHTAPYDAQHVPGMQISCLSVVHKHPWSVHKPRCCSRLNCIIHSVALNTLPGRQLSPQDCVRQCSTCTVFPATRDSTTQARSAHSNPPACLHPHASKQRRSEIQTNPATVRHAELACCWLEASVHEVYGMRCSRCCWGGETSTNTCPCGACFQSQIVVCSICWPSLPHTVVTQQQDQHTPRIAHTTQNMNKAAALVV